MGSKTYTTNLCSQYICLCFLTIRSGYLFLDSKNIKTLCVCVMLFLWVCVYKMLLINLFLDSKNIKTLLCVCVMLFCEFVYIKCYLLQLLKLITLQHYHVRYVLSFLCFGTALGEVFTVFGGLDCTVDVETLTVLGIPHKKKKCVEYLIQWKFQRQQYNPNRQTLHQEQYRSIRMTART